MTNLNINGRAWQVSAPADTPLLWALRDELGHTGTKFGCGMALCGSCTVHVDGQPTRSCTLPISRPRTTKSPPSKAWRTTASAASYKTPGPNWAWRNAATARRPDHVGGGLLKQNTRPTDKQIDTAMNGNICRCGTYPRIRAAIQLAARRLRGGRA
jgi:isoquinoline 1-oxidoreductase alpha subunit